MATTREIRQAILDDWYTRDVPVDTVLNFEATFDIEFETWSCVDELSDGRLVDSFRYGRQWETIPA